VVDVRADQPHLDDARGIAAPAEDVVGERRVVVAVARARAEKLVGRLDVVEEAEFEILEQIGEFARREFRGRLEVAQGERLPGTELRPGRGSGDERQRQQRQDRRGESGDAPESELR
jgi:hypothetical protein